MDKNSLENKLKRAGHRMTKTRSLLVNLFENDQLPLSISEITAYLENHGRFVNKTTIYRELGFLLDQKILKELDLSEGKKRYELASLSHHHHLICLKCKDIQEIYLNNDLDHQEKDIFDQKHFQVTDHMLEFFGVCKNCRP